MFGIGCNREQPQKKKVIAYPNEYPPVSYAVDAILEFILKNFFVFSHLVIGISAFL